MLGLSHLCGLVLHILYYGCDPVVSQKIHKTEEILPLFISEYGRNIHGLAGLFLAGLISASLSTISAKLNSGAGVVYHDFILRVYGGSLSDSTVTLILKISVIIIGAICILLGFLIDRMGELIQV